MSGRRSSSADGICAGTAGGVAVSGDGGIENVEAGSPTSTAIACSSWARCNAVVDGGGLRRLQLRLRLNHVGAGGDACRVLVLRELAASAVGRDGVVEQLLGRIERAQREVGLRERALRGQPRVGESGRGALLAGFLRIDRAA